MLNNQKGAAHYLLAVLLAVGVTIWALTPKSPSPTSRQSNINAPQPAQPDLETTSTENYISRPVDKRLEEAEYILYSAVQAQSRLLKVKADMILLAWDTLSPKEQQALITSFSREFQRSREITDKFIEEFGSPRWLAMEDSRKRAKIGELLKSLSVSNEDIAGFAKLLTTLKGPR